MPSSVGYALPRSISSPIIATISSTYSVACGTSVGRFTLMPAIASNHTRSHLVVMSCHGRPSRWARSMILSSMSVMFDTRRTSSPDHSR